MKHPRKSRKSRKSRNLHMVKRKQKGGLLENEGFPHCNTMAFFPITTAGLASFQRVFAVPGDCVISALHIMGALDQRNADIMRVATLTGSPWVLATEQIPLIFMYSFRQNFIFSRTDNYVQFGQMIRDHLPHGTVVFAGYEAGDNGGRPTHVFIIGRQDDGRIVYIDPQTNPPYCDLSDPRCEGLIGGPGIRSWWLLYFNQTLLSQAQLNRVMDYTTQLAVAVQGPGGHIYRR